MGRARGCKHLHFMSNQTIVLKPFSQASSLEPVAPKPAPAKAFGGMPSCRWENSFDRNIRIVRAARLALCYWHGHQCDTFRRRTDETNSATNRRAKGSSNIRPPLASRRRARRLPRRHLRFRRVEHRNLLPSLMPRQTCAPRKRKLFQQCPPGRAVGLSRCSTETRIA